MKTQPEGAALTEIWKCVRSELDREHGESYRWLFRDENSEQPGAIEPFRMACYMGFKITTILYFPLTNDIFRFFWSLWHLLVMFTIMYLSSARTRAITAYEYDYYYDDDDDAVRLVKVIIYSLEGITVIALLVAIADVAICTAYWIRKRLWHMCCRIPLEEQPLLGGGSRSRLKSVAQWWNKYSDIPRFVVTEVLLILLSCPGILHFGFSTLYSVAVGQYFLISVVEFIILLIVLGKSTCYKNNLGVNYRGTWFLFPFIIHFTLTRTFVLYYMNTLLYYHIFFSYDTMQMSIWLLVVSYVLIPFLGMTLFFMLTYKSLKLSLTKTFKDFLDYLYLHQQNGSQHEREKIQNMLDRFQYEILDSSQRLNNKVTSHIPNPLHLTFPVALLICYICFLVMFCYMIHISGIISRPFFRGLLALVVSSNVVIIAIIVWLVYGLICIVKGRLQN